MDIPRPELKRQRRIRRFVIAGGSVLLLILITGGLSRLKPSAPTVVRASIWVDAVRAGELVREVRGTGTLVPREIRWIAAQSDGRIDRILVRPGAAVAADTILVEMSDPALMQQAEQARYELLAAQSAAAELKLQLRSQQLDQQAALALARAEYKGAQLQADAEKSLVEKGIVAAIQYQRSELRSEQLKIRMDVEQERLEQFSSSMQAQLNSQRAKVDQARNTYQRRSEQVEALQVRAGTAGVLQQVQVSEGQRITLGTNIARVARPDALQAQLRVPETQARDVQLGQTAKIDTRNGIVTGRVIRIDPAVQAGAVQLDIELTGELPKGARPDLSVEGVIEIERVAHAVFVGRPAAGRPNATVNLFKLVEEGRYAVRVPVKLGRTSSNAAEIAQGLVAGDQVILSDTSDWDAHERIRLK